MGPSENCESSVEVLASIHPWIMGQHVDVLHINCGMHDLRMVRLTGQHKVSIDSYADKLERIFEWLRSPPQLRVIWATPTPLDQPRHDRSLHSLRRESDVFAYNKRSFEIARRFGAQINVLSGAETTHDHGHLLGADGIHFTAQGSEFLAAEVVSSIRRALAPAV